MLLAFRERLIAHDLDRRLVARTALAKTRGGFGRQALRDALDSSPLLGAVRVEDTGSLIGRAMQPVVTCAAHTLGLTRDEVLTAADLPLLRAPSLKAALDIDWQDPAAQASALAQLLAEVDRLETWVGDARAVADAPTVQAALTMLRRVLTQDLEPDPTTGQRRIRQGVARDRQPSIGDPVVRPANEPEHLTLATVTPALATHAPLGELFIDRGYLASATVPVLHAAGVTIRGKAWTSAHRGRFPKQAFAIDVARAKVTCPAGNRIAIPAGATFVHFAAATCQACPQRAACTTARTGRSVTLHPQEALLQELRTRQRQPAGRATLRTRVQVEYTLSACRPCKAVALATNASARTPSTCAVPRRSSTCNVPRDSLPLPD